LGLQLFFRFPFTDAALLILLADTTIHRFDTLPNNLSLILPRPFDDEPTWRPHMMLAPRPGSPMSRKAGLLPRSSKRTLTETRSRSFSSWPMERYAHHRSFCCTRVGADGLIQTRSIETTLAAIADGKDPKLPPLMNPTMLEASDDLTNLSHLNEPAGNHASLAL
jgi:hypothetical protein